MDGQRDDLESARFHTGGGNVHATLREPASDLDRVGLEYAIIEDMALNAHDFARETTDVDVLVTSEGLERFQQPLMGRAYLPAFSGADKSFCNTRTGIVVEFIKSGEFPEDGPFLNRWYSLALRSGSGERRIQVRRLPRSHRLETRIRHDSALQAS